jgi:N-acetylglucosaminyldiphosphoundecaprenol N-acetyl-beta-D-mannosaminyltransferase
MKATADRESADVLGIQVDAVDMESALAYIWAALQARRKGYICVASVHGIMEAQRSNEIASIYTASQMTVPDGMPLVWVGRIQGCQSMRRVTGPDLMLEIFRRPQFAGVTHFLYGGRAGVADELRDRIVRDFPWVRIVGACTPPYHDLSPAEEQQLAARVDEGKPAIMWIGLGCPRQELFMSRYLPLLNTTLMLGVGAAFDFHTGRIRDCPDWMKRAGMQWLHRLVQDPRRLGRRYLRIVPAFLWHIGLQLSGLRHLAQPLRAHALEDRPQSEAQRR